jgi:protein-S-isoprenylcysteine O-methyltransferase Ste14
VTKAARISPDYILVVENRLTPIRLYLLAGLVFHKAVWEVMKRRAGTPAPEKQPSSKAKILSAVKIAILAAIVVQTFLPDFLPILEHPENLRKAGLILYSMGLAIAVSARIQLGQNWSDIEKSFVSRGHLLVARGLYKFVRHPIYTGDLILLAGLELTLNSWAVLAVVPMMFYVRMQAVKEERRLLDSLPGYQQYYNQTSRFLPFSHLIGK